MTKLSIDGRLRRAAALAFMGGTAGTLLAPAEVFAQDTATPPATELQGVQVTGSLLRRVDTETANPVTTINRAAIDNSGVTTMGQLLEQLPQLSGDALTPQVNNGGSGDGASTISLRGLGSARTLILVDGKRVISNDVNVYPINMIDHIEILNQGGGTVYGSDAIGGVVNFITRKKYQGTEITASYGQATDKGDGTKFQTSITQGLSTPKGHMVFGLSYDKNGSIKGKDRSVSNDVYGIYYNHVYTSATGLGSSRIPTGLFSLSGPSAAAGTVNGKTYDFVDANGVGCNQITRIPTAKGTDTGTADKASLQANFECRASLGAASSYNYQAENLVYVPTQRVHLFASGENKFTDNITGYASAFFTHTTGHNQLASEAFDSASLSDPNGNALNLVISQYSQYNPSGSDINAFKFRAVDTGDRHTDANENIYQGTLGVKATLFDRFDWDNSFTYGREDDTFVNSGYLNVSQMAQQLGPSKGGQCFTDGTYTTVIPGCIPVNVMGTIGNNYGNLSKPAVNTDYGDEEIFNSNIDGEIVNLPAGPLNAALGLEFRELHYSSTPDNAAQLFQLSEANGSITAGQYNVKEVYGELNIPVLKDLPGIKSLTVDVGTRYSRYSNFSDTQNNKFQAEWRPVKDLLVRATYADVFRAPTITDLYGGAANSAPSYTDPCNGYTGAATAQFPNLPAACKNVPADGSFQQADAQGSVRVGGNPTVKPERGYTTDFGFVYDPDFYKPLTVHADYWRFSIRQAIESLDLNTALQACATSGSAVYCGDNSANSPFVRDATPGAEQGQIVGGLSGPANIGTLFTDGYDFGFALNFPKTRFGSFMFDVNATYLDKFKQAVQDVNSYSQAGEVGGASDFIGGGYPRMKFDATLDWSYKNFLVVLRNRFVSTERDDGGQDGLGNTLGTDISGYGFNCRGVINIGDGVQAMCSRQTGYVDYQDAAVTYKAKPLKTDFTLGVYDMFDQGAPIVYTFGPAFNYDASNTDVTGRYVYGRVAVHFK